LALFQVGIAINDIRKLKGLPAAEKAVSEKAKKLLDDGELDRVIRETQNYAATLPQEHPFRKYMELLTARC